jgi:hypothetical protein
MDHLQGCLCCGGRRRAMEAHHPMTIGFYQGGLSFLFFFRRRVFT